LKKLVADRDLELDVMREISRKRWRACKGEINGRPAFRRSLLAVGLTGQGLPTVGSGSP
jgi:hypothetical protein